MSIKSCKVCTYEYKFKHYRSMGAKMTFLGVGQLERYCVLHSLVRSKSYIYASTD